MKTSTQYSAERRERAVRFSRIAKREKRPLGDFFGLNNFGVNLTRVAPGGESALMHAHSRQDELIYVLEGETTLAPGMCAGFAARGEAHHVVNRTDRDAVTADMQGYARRHPRTACAGGC